MNNKKHILPSSSIIKEALLRLDILAKDAIIFIVDSNKKLIGSLTDGDVRRGLLKDVTINDSVLKIIQPEFKFILKDDYDLTELIKLRDGNYKVLPVIDSNGIIVDIVNFRLQKSYLPLDAVIMAGGRGIRLKPLTDNTPKPLLHIGEKRIMEYSVDRLNLFGINDFWFSVNYLGKQIEMFFGNGSDKNKSIEYVWEDSPLGTIGAVSKIKNFKHDYILITNSDILTNLDYEKFFIDFKTKDADLSIVSIPYHVNVPYAVLEISENELITGFKEKPNYTYESNGGIYLIKKSLLEFIPKNTFFNATDLIEKLISKNKKVISYTLNDYWLDVGKHEDYIKAKKDIDNIKF
jgi:dTDP-glucose pyrophosphorylase